VTGTNRRNTETTDFRPLSTPPKELSKALTDLSKFYTDDKLKFRGDKYQYLRIELLMFYENCEKVGLREVDFNRGFSTMLGGHAKEYYFEKLAYQTPRLTFRQMCKAIQDHFETSERILDYQQEWMAISLQRIIDNNPTKTKLDCLEIMFTDIRKIQPGIPPASSTDQQLRDRAHQAVLGVPECNMALMNPPSTWEGLCNMLRSSIGTETRSGKRQDQFLQYNDHEVDQYFVDRSYSGRGGNRGQARGDFGGGYKGSRFRGNNGFQGRSGYTPISTRKKRCYICSKEGCWSNKHTQEERDQAYDEFKKVARNATSAAYHHFLIDFEGIELDSKEARREETEQLLMEAEGMVDLYEDE
jgi:hypothetical protein